MKVRGLPVDPGPAGWNRLLPDPAPAVPLVGRLTADWLVIGAGFAGLSAARRLSQLDPGSRIVVVDATRIGEGPAGRNSGFMVDLPHNLTSEDYAGAVDDDIEQARNNRRAIEFASGIAEEFGLGAEAFNRSGKINAAATARGHRRNLSYAKHLDAMGEPYELLDADQMREITGIGYYRNGLFTPGAAVMQPALYVRGLAEALRSGGVSVHEESPVTELRRSGDWLAVTPRGQVVSPRVILAVNGHLNSYGFLPGRLAHVFTYASMTRALDSDEVRRLGGRPVWGVTPADPLGTTVRRISGTGGERIVVRCRFTFDPSMRASERRLDRAARSHDRAFAARFPMLEGVGMEFRWGGRLCLSLNGVQVIRELEEGLFSACCQNGIGTARGTFAGMSVAELACGIGSESLDHVLSAPLPSRLPPGPVARIGAWLRIRCSEAMARGEL
ncbi:MAG: FAD-binding oxidoreductase [Rhodobacter sp.]|nr:FAD-binding oxidoreductase [Rhodobacter sp.]